MADCAVTYPASHPPKRGWLIPAVAGIAGIAIGAGIWAGHHRIRADLMRAGIGACCTIQAASPSTFATPICGIGIKIRRLPAPEIDRRERNRQSPKLSGRLVLVPPMVGVVG